MKARVMPVVVVDHVLGIQLAFTKRSWKEEEGEKQVVGRTGREGGSGRSLVLLGKVLVISSSILSFS